jgi:hypothetical protein
MNRKFFKSIVVPFLVVTGFMIVQSCSTFSLKPPQERLRDRVQAMMDAKIKNDWAKVYDYLSPSYQKTISKDAFSRMSRSVYFIKYAINSINIGPSGSEANVEVNYDADLKGFDMKNRIEKQTWIKVEGEWYLDIHVPKNKLE